MVLNVNINDSSDCLNLLHFHFRNENERVKNFRDASMNIQMIIMTAMAVTVAGMLTFMRSAHASTSTGVPIYVKTACDTRTGMYLKNDILISCKGSRPVNMEPIFGDLDGSRKFEFSILEYRGHPGSNCSLPYRTGGEGGRQIAECGWERYSEPVSPICRQWWDKCVPESWQQWRKYPGITICYVLLAIA
jgi:hypothetical protein